MQSLFERCARMNRQCRGIDFSGNSDSSHKWARSVDSPSLKSMPPSRSLAAPATNPARSRLRKRCGASTAVVWQESAMGRTALSDRLPTLQAGRARRRAAERAGNVKQVAGPRAGAEQGFATRLRTREDNVGDNKRRFRQVAARQRRLKGIGQREKSIQKPGDPGLAPFCFLGEFLRNAKDKKAATGRAPMAARSLRPRARLRCPMDSGVCHSGERAPGDGKVGGDGKLLATPDAKQSAVVADPERNPPWAPL